jgi:hypothetical protein
MTPRQEGYRDGVTGNGLRENLDALPVDILEYERGFLLGSADRWRLRQPREVWPDQSIFHDAEGRN